MDEVELNIGEKEKALDLKLLPTYLGSPSRNKVSLEFFSPAMLETLQQEDLESFAIDDLIGFIECSWSSFENSALVEKTLELLPPGESWNRNTWEDVTKVLDELVDSSDYSKGMDSTAQVVGNESLEGFGVGEDVGSSWTKVLRCKLCFRFISVENFGNHLIVFHSSEIKYSSEVQQLEEETFNNNTSKSHVFGYRNVFNPVSPFFYGDEERVAQLRHMDKERRRHLDARVLQCPRVYKKRRRSPSEDIPTFASKWKLQKDKKSSTNDPLNAMKEGLDQETEDSLAPLMVTCTTYLAAMHDLNKVEQDKTFLKEFPDHVDLSFDRLQNQRCFENALHLLVKKRNMEGNNSDYLERQRHMREAIYSNKKDRRNNSFLTESGLLLVSKNEADLAVASSSSFRSKMSGVRMDNNGPDSSTLRNGNISWNNAYYPRPTSSSSAAALSRSNQDNRMAPSAQANMIDTKYSGVTGKIPADNKFLMEADNNTQQVKNELQSYSSKLPIPASSQSVFALSSAHSRSLVSSKGLPDNIPNQNMTMNRQSLSSDQLQQLTMQSSSLGGSKGINQPPQNVNSASIKVNDSKTFKEKKKSTKGVKRERSCAEPLIAHTNRFENQGETISKSNSDRIPKERVDGKDSNITAVNASRSNYNPSSMMMFTSKSPRILSNASLSAPKSVSSLSENTGQRQPQVGPTKHLNELVGFVERKLGSNRSEQYMNERSAMSTPYYGTSSVGEESGMRDFHENVSSYSPLEYWKRSDRRSASNYQTGLEALSEEHSSKAENSLSNNYNLLWKEQQLLAANNLPIQKGQLSNQPTWTSRSLSSKSNVYEDDYFDLSYGINDGVFSPRSFIMDRNAVQHEYNSKQSKNLELASPMQELSENSTDARSSRIDLVSDFQGQKPTLRNVQSPNNYLESSGFMPDSVPSSYRAPINKTVRNMDNNYPKELAKAVHSRNGQVPMRNVTFGSFGLNTVSATSLQRGGGGTSQARESGQQKSEETYGILQNLRGGGSQSLSSFMTSVDPTVPSRKMNLTNTFERTDSKQLHRLNSPTLVSSPHLDNHSPSIDSRFTLSTGNLRRKEYRIRTNSHEDTNFGTNSEDISRSHR